MVKVILHKAASPPRTDHSIVFVRWRKCALPIEFFVPCITTLSLGVCNNDISLLVKQQMTNPNVERKKTKKEKTPKNESYIEVNSYKK